MRAFLVLLVASFALLSSLAPAAPELKLVDPVLKPNDIVKMQVFDEDELTTEIAVMRSGEVSLPLIGNVTIGGLTVSKANDVIRNLYAQDYLVDPKITLTVKEYSVELVSVEGSVKSPGQFPLPVSGKFNLSNAIVAAGGLTPEADINRITLIRVTGATTSHSQASIQTGAAVALQPGDRVVVQQNPFVNKSVMVLGQVVKAGAVPFPLNGRLEVVNAIAQAGGFSELANKKKVIVSRKGKAPETLNLKDAESEDQRYLLQPEDTVTVEERIF